ncbi:MAG: hypothetical protein QXL46_03730 [Nitrososphaerales archaeon]
MNILKDIVETFPKGAGLVKIRATFDDSDKEIELTYNPKRRRLYGLTEWYRRHNAQVGDIVIIEPIEDNKYRFRFEKGEKLPPSEIPNHNEIRDMIHEIGELEGKVSEIEYRIDSYRLDVVWKRIKAGNPSHVFEVQISGNFFEALTKLKHAWDKWNSKPYLVTTEKYIDEAKQLLEGSFHEIEHIARIVNWRRVKELYELERKIIEIRNEIGV